MTFRYLKTLIFNNFFKILHFMFLFLTSIICRVFYTGGRGDGDGEGAPHQPKICSSPTHGKIPPPTKNLIKTLNKNLIFSCNHCSCTIFILISYSLYTPSHANFDFNWCSIFTEGQSSSGSHHTIKNIARPKQNFQSPP